MPDPTNLIAALSLATSIGAAGFTWWQASTAKAALKAAELSAEAAKESAQTSATLTAIEKARYKVERRPKWYVIVERSNYPDVARLRLKLEAGEVDRVTVEIASPNRLQFSAQQQPSFTSGKVHSPALAEFGPLQVEDSAYWYTTEPSQGGWVKGPIRITSHLGDIVWETEHYIDQADTKQSAFQERLPRNFDSDMAPAEA
ncbi:hypothetical protein ACFXG4_04030 [Nocardia sp. NPDC059246]|uniref:hypothetical protein n=1 Tax=unclassified Nocardia TaxID=2637762 RepID=UPI0036874EF5